jgi:S1-C subfamily serine protease
MKQEIYDKIKSATVAVCIRFPNGELKPFGSGINVDPRGLIITCKHVIEGAQFSLYSKGTTPPFPKPSHGMQTGQIHMADLVFVFSLIVNGEVELGIARPFCMTGPQDFDLAAVLLKPDEAMPAVELGNSDDVFEGQSGFTCGFPLGENLQPGAPTGPLFHRGIISGIRPHYLIKPRDRFFLDMSINPGASGSPLCEESSGLVVGIVNARVGTDQTGIGLAVPINLIKPFADDLLQMSIEDLEKRRENWQLE